MRIKLLLLFLAISFYSSRGLAQGTWSNLGNGIHKGAEIFAICPDTVNNVLYAGGEFDTVSSFRQIAFAKWDGTQWDSTVKFYDSTTQIDALIMFQGSLYVGFDNGEVGIYDGSTLKYINPLYSSVHCFYIYNDTLYAGGTFTGAISKFDGTNWLPVGSGMSYIYCCPDVKALTEYNGQLIAAGQFDSAGGVFSPSIAAYNDTNWLALSNGLDMFDYSPGIVEALEVYNNNLYASGDFSFADSIPANYIAVWNGIIWDSLQQNPEAPIAALKSFDGYLFLGTSGGYAHQFIYKYDGTSVTTVDSGVFGHVSALNSWNGSLYVGGIIDSAGKKIVANSIARWTPDTVSTSISQLPTSNQQAIIYPNPFSISATFKFSQPTTNLQLQLVDLTGRQVQEYIIPNNSKTFTIKRNNLPAGMYFYKLISNDVQMVAGKIVVE